MRQTANELGIPIFVAVVDLGAGRKTAILHNLEAIELSSSRPSLWLSYRCFLPFFSLGNKGGNLGQPAVGIVTVWEQWEWIRSGYNS